MWDDSGIYFAASGTYFFRLKVFSATIHGKTGLQLFHLTFILNKLNDRWEI